ncbi:NAD(P)-dependent alcohol dehydrogenase [Elongatibacter sediminis]|uniref:NAD(P)-dependent alcohol dehydrogenase n=1 Tax=Elongatibacter sediminis TaxID=3119006 RepID=A0AAW9REQ7_9GAMM
MKAAVLNEFNRELALTEVEDPRIQHPGDVIVRVTGAGVCGSDVHWIEGAFKDVLGAPEFPYVLGHENGGYVEAVGSAVTSLQVGDPVLAHPHITCGLCRACRRNEASFCESLRFPGIDGRTAGGFAELFRTTEHALVKLPPGTDPAPMASLADAGLTAYHAVRRACGDLPADGVAVVIGVGGVGYFALQLLRLFSPARLIAVDRVAEKLRDAETLGADLTLSAGDELVDQVMEATGGTGVDLVMDCVGVAPVPEQSLAMLRRGGVYSALGADTGEACCGTLALTGRELTIKGNLVGTLGELAELAQLAARNRIQLTQTSYPLQDINRALSDLRHGTVRGRAVLVP